MSIYMASQTLYNLKKNNIRRELQQISTVKEGGTYPLHPTLVALSIVLSSDGDLGTINQSHPGRHTHRFYNASAKFPTDILHLLPPSKDRWWEILGKLSFPRLP